MTNTLTTTRRQDDYGLDWFVEHTNRKAVLARGFDSHLVHYEDLRIPSLQ